jgi:hypothetical protein
MLRDLKNAVKGLKLQNREYRDRLRYAVLVEEHKELVTSLRAELEANANDKKAWMQKIATMDKELVMYKFLIKCCVMLVVILAMCMIWLVK